MRAAGFVLVGGASRRMGRDKALLNRNGVTLAEYLCGEVRAAAGSVTMVGASERYRSLGIELLADLRPGQGPLAGMESALSASAAEWNLIVACDLPHMTRFVLCGLLDAAVSQFDAIIPAHSDGTLEPLCAVYHRRSLPTIQRALDLENLKVLDMVASLKVLRHPITAPEEFRNVNTPAEWMGAQLD
jgi:molybdopterin-guanine dinucleotide biosynthesis protein A